MFWIEDDCFFVEVPVPSFLAYRVLIVVVVLYLKKMISLVMCRVAGFVSRSLNNNRNRIKICDSLLRLAVISCQAWQQKKPPQLLRALIGSDTTSRAIKFNYYYYYTTFLRKRIITLLIFGKI